jgi:hypothetical protein
MSHYRAYLIAGNGHHIKAVDFDCVDDDAARNAPSNSSTVVMSSCESTRAGLRSSTASCDERLSETHDLVHQKR